VGNGSKQLIDELTYMPAGIQFITVIYLNSS